MTTGLRPQTEREFWIGDGVDRARTFLLFFLATAGYVSVSFLPEVLGVTSRVITVPYRALFMAAAIWAIVIAVRRGRINVPWVLAIPFIIFWYIYLWRIGADGVFTSVDTRLPWSHYYLYAIGTSLLPMIALWALPDFRGLEEAFWASLVVLGLACIVAFARSLLGLSQSQRLIGLGALGAINFGHAGTTLAILGLFRLAVYQDSVLRKCLLLAAVTIGVISVGGSLTRSAVLALVLLLPLILLAGYRSGRRRRAVFVAAGVTVAAIVLAQTFFVGVITRFRLIAWQGNPRLPIYDRSLEQFLSSPLFGGGLEERLNQIYPHNLFLEAFMATGTIGGTFLSIGVLSAVGLALWLVWRRPHIAWPGIIFLQYLIAAQFSGALYSRTAMWSMMGAVFGLWAGSREPSLGRKASSTASGRSVRALSGPL